MGSKSMASQRGSLPWVCSPFCEEVGEIEAARVSYCELGLGGWVGGWVGGWETYRHGFRPKGAFQAAAGAVLVDANEGPGDAGEEHGGPHALGEFLDGVEVALCGRWVGGWIEEKEVV